MPSLRICYILFISFSALQCTGIATSDINQPLPSVVDSNASGENTHLATATAEDADLLKWALKNSNIESLHQQALAAKNAHKNDPDTAERRARAAELLHAASAMPTESNLMEEAVLVLRNTSSTVENKHAALEALIVLVEPIDNANHLLKIVNASWEINRLLDSSPLLEAAAARVVGVAASNNEFFSNELIQRHPDVILRLAQLLGSSVDNDDDVVGAAIYAAGQLLRNSGHARSLWNPEVLITLIRGGKHVSERNRKKALTLSGDLILLDNDDDINNGESSGCRIFLGCDSLIRVLLDVLEEQYKGEDDSSSRKKMDVDLLEKAFLALQAARQQNTSGVGGGEDSNGNGDRSERVTGALVEILRQGDEYGKISEYEADVIALAEQL
jgi:nucleotide exchange factor SIL1